MHANNYLVQNESLLNEMNGCFDKEKQHFVKDGLLYRGDISYSHDGYWKRAPVQKKVESDMDEGILWDKAPLRVMFLMKDYIDDSMDDIRFETGRKNLIDEGQDPIKRDAFTMNIVYWLYGLTHITNNPSLLFSNIEEGSQCFRFYERYPLARINCKKISGSSTCSNKTLQDYLHMPKYSKLLGEQIELFKANVIVCCGGGGSIAQFVKDQCYKTGHWQQFEKESLWYNEDEEVLVIDTYHPSYYKYSRRERFEGITGCFQRFAAAHQNYHKKLKEMEKYEQIVMESMTYLGQYSPD